MKNYYARFRLKLFAPKLICGFVASLLIATIARADDPAPADKKEPPKKWDSNITAGLTLTRGNSKNFLASIAAATKRSWLNDEALFGASAGYGETQSTVNGSKVDTTTDSYVRGFAQWNHLFTQKFYAGLRVSGDHDDVADLAYRVTVSPLAGYYFIKTTNSFLAAEIGPSYIQEKFFNQSTDEYLALRIAERGEYKFKSGAKIWESVEYLPKVEDFSDYIINAEAGVSAPISKGFAVSLVIQDTFNTDPAPGKLQNDFKLIAGLTYTF